MSTPIIGDKYHEEGIPAWDSQIVSTKMLDPPDKNPVGYIDLYSGEHLQ